MLALNGGIAVDSVAETYLFLFVVLVILFVLSNFILGKLLVGSIIAIRCCFGALLCSSCTNVLCGYI